MLLPPAPLHLLPPSNSFDHAATAESSTTPRRTGGVADGATEEEKRQDQLLRRSFSSPSVAEDAADVVDPAQSASNHAYPAGAATANRVQPAFSNPLKVID